MMRYDVMSHAMSEVYNVETLLGAGRVIWQMHSSDDDHVHSATVKDSSSYKELGCIAFDDRHPSSPTFVAAKGDYDECQIDKSGRYLVIKENVDGKNGEDNRIIDLNTGNETIFLDENGAAGHSDLGFGYMVAREIATELPHANRTRHRVEVVLGDHVAEAEIGVARRAVLVEEDRLVAGVQVDDAVVLAVLAINVFLDDEITAALVDLALVVVALCGNEGRARRMPIVERDAPQLLVGGAVLDGGGVHVIVVARVHLPDDAARAEQRLHVVDLAHGVRHHVVAHHPWSVIEIERGRLRRAEIPAFARRPAQIVVGREKRPEVLRVAGSLVEGEQRRPAASLAALEAHEDQHRVAADVVVDVAPIRLADRKHAILPAAVAGVRQTNALRAVRRGEREGAALRHERSDFARRQLRPYARSEERRVGKEC